MKLSALNTDLQVNNQVSLASWAVGQGSINKVSAKNAISPTTFASGFGITPSTGTNGAIFSNTSGAAGALGQLFSSMLSSGRAGGQAALTAASCGFSGDAGMASSTFGINLFTPANIAGNPFATGNATGLNLNANNGGLTLQEQAFLAAYYQSAIGQLGAITSDDPGADYHNQNVQTTISPYDQGIALKLRMWLLASFIANQPSAFILSTNGTPGPTGTQNVAITGVTGSGTGGSGTATVNVNGNDAQGDNGGTSSAEAIFLFTPVGKTPPMLYSTGTLNTDGSTPKASPSIPSVPAAIGSLYFTALNHIAAFNPSGVKLTAFQAELVAKGITPYNMLNANG